MTRTRVRVIGASPLVMRRLRAMAPARVDVVDEPLAEPDWILVPDHAHRVEAIRSSGLSPFRVLEVPAISSELDPSSGEALAAALVKMGQIGVFRAGESPLGVRLASIVVRRLIA